MTAKKMLADELYPILIPCFTNDNEPALLSFDKNEGINITHDKEAIKAYQKKLDEL